MDGALWGPPVVPPIDTRRVFDHLRIIENNVGSLLGGALSAKNLDDLTSKIDDARCELDAIKALDAASIMEQWKNGTARR